MKKVSIYLIAGYLIARFLLGFMVGLTRGLWRGMRAARRRHRVEA